MATDAGGIEQMLEHACHNYDVLITGRKTDGEPYNRRRVSPRHIHRAPGGDLLRCTDRSSGQIRSFRLDGITMVEVAE